MRPGLTKSRLYEPPRWRRRRAADLRDIAVAYFAAIAVCLGLLAAASLWPSWFIVPGERFVTMLRIGLLLATYLSAGGMVLSLIVHRVVFWKGTPIERIPVVRWYTVAIW